MKPTLLLLSTFALLLAAAPLAFAQNYNAGLNSGAGGVENTHVGAYAGQYDNGSGNSFLGYMAGQFSSGSYNSYVGNAAGYFNTGSFNSFVGYRAGQNNSSFYNSFLGTYAGYYNTNGIGNSFLGSFAGKFNTGGSYNNFVGYLAGLSNTTGSGNSFLGSEAGYNNTTGYNNSFLGSTAGLSNTTGSYNTFVGTYAGYSNTTGSSNSFLGDNAGNGNQTGNGNTALGSTTTYSADNLSNATAIGYQAQVNASNSLVLGSIKGVNGATSDTKVGIRTTAPAYNLHVNGSVAKPGGSAWTVASDQRLKQEVIDFKDGLAVIEKIKPVWFRYNGKADLPTDKQYVGVMAQEMQQIAPYTIGEFTYQDSTGKQEKYLDYDANAVKYMLVNAVKEQQAQLQEKEAQIQEQQTRNQQQQTQIVALQTRLSRLEALLAKPSPEKPSPAQLYQNEPNPTDGSTVIRYYIPREASSAQLKVYSMTGEEVHRIELQQKGAGQVQLSGRELASGVYVYRLFIDGKSVASRKLVLEK